MMQKIQKYDDEKFTIWLYRYICRQIVNIGWFGQKGCYLTEPKLQNRAKSNTNESTVQKAGGMNKLWRWSMIGQIRLWDAIPYLSLTYCTLALKSPFNYRIMCQRCQRCHCIVERRLPALWEYKECFFRHLWRYTLMNIQSLNFRQLYNYIIICIVSAAQIIQTTKGPGLHNLRLDQQIWSKHWSSKCL